MLIALNKSEFSRNILKMFSGVFISQIIVVFGSLILARLYSPEQFGHLSLFISIVSLFSILATVRYENAIIIIKNNKLVSHITKFLHLSSFVFFILVLLTLLLLSLDVLTYLKIDKYHLNIPIAILIYAYFQISTNINVRHKNFSTIATSKILLVVVTLLSQLIFYYLDIELGLIYGYVLGYLAAVFILYKKVYEPFTINFNHRKTRALLKRYFYFVKHALPADFINSLSVNIMPLLIAIWFDMTIAGLYFLSYRIVNLPLQLISATVGKVYFQKISEMYHTDKTQLYLFTKKIVIMLLLIIIVPLIILFLYGEEIITLVLGASWSDAGVYISLLSVMFFFRTLFSPISSVAEVVKKVYIVLYFSIYILLTTIVSLYIGHIYNNFNLSIIILSITVSFGYLFLLLYFMNYLKRLKNEC